MRSPAQRLNYKKWAKNALIFAGPALLVLLASFTEIVPKDAWWGAVALYLLNLGTDLFKKWLQVNRY